jgi:cyclohexadieny/prephenate dehydrogenase
MADPLFRRIAFIGIGLIGSSLARVVRRDGLAGSVVACARSQATRDAALALNLCDEAMEDPAAAVAGCDLVVLCTPLGAYEAIAKRIAPALEPGCIVSDVGSVKAIMDRAVKPHLPEGVHMVPGHPVAGTENSGPESGFAELFEGHYTVLTPAADADPDAVAKIEALWRATGCMVERMEASHHDQVLAITSHVPHIVAYTIVGTATDLEGRLRSEVIKYAASGFRDFTRIAASDPVMWRDIFLNNKEAVLEMLGRLIEDIYGVQRAIRDGDGDTLQALFTRTREIRRGVVAAGQHIAPQRPDGEK